MSMWFSMNHSKVVHFAGKQSKTATLGLRYPALQQDFSAAYP